MRKISFILLLVTSTFYISAQEYNEAYLNSLPEAVREDVIEKRLKNFTGKRMNVYLPESFTKNKKLLRELDYFLRFVSNLNLIMRPVFINNEKFYIPSHHINIAKDKIESLNEKFKNIKAVIV